MATIATAPPITIDQYLNFEGYPGLRDELINGRIVLSPQPKPFHQQVVENVYLALREAFKGSGYAVKQNTNIQFGGANSMPAPDVFVVSKHAWSEAVAKSTYLSEPPLVVVEVLSPANRARKVDEKSLVYLANGVGNLWIADLKRRSLFEVRLQGGILQRREVTALSLEQPVAVDLPTARIFDCTLD